MIDEDVLAAMREAAAAAGGDLSAEPRLAYEAARRLAGDGWRDLYLAYWDAAHPCDGPIEEGVLQPGDRVRYVGEQGARQGPATVTRVTARETLAGAVTHDLEYVLDEPYRDRDGSAKVGAVASPGGLVHLRDWPRTFLGWRPDYEIREGEGPRPADWPAP